jgi:segregation and condensation protein A
MGYEIKLDIFEGPLDLLLYLIKKNEIDIYDIPMALITRQYLEYIEMLGSLNLDLAGEFLILAATLIHIKSRLLLPVEEDPSAEEEEDPRAELVRQLLDYQAFKEAALQLDSRPVLERDVFTRSCPAAEPDDPPPPGVFVEMDVFDLVKAFQQDGRDRNRRGGNVAGRPHQ